MIINTLISITKRNFQIILLWGLYLGAPCAKAQPYLHNVKNATGASFSNDNYYFEWNIGELTGVKTLHSNSLTVTEGFCQTMIYSLKLNETERNNLLKQFQVFPVPCQKEVFVLSRMSTPVNVDVMIIDDAGRIQQRRLLFLNNETKVAINTSQLLPGHYKLLLRVREMNGSGQIYPYDIIKN